MNSYLKRYTAWIMASLISLSLLLGSGVNLTIQNASAAVLVLGKPLTNNAVLQRSMSAPVFGTAAAGANVSVSFNGQNLSTTADAAGKWRVNLASMTANTAPGNMVITSGAETITLTGLQVGEVWLCSGQSNMLFALTNAVDGPAAAADAPNHNMRLFEDLGPWQVSNATTAGNFSAICYWFGLELSNSLGNGVPIGLIQEAQGGTSIHEWTNCCGGSKAGSLYNAWIAPLIPYAIRGANWYQGENDAHFGPEGYYTKMMGLMNEWRTNWGQGNFHFQLGQLHWNGASEGWASVRQDLLQASLDAPNAVLAVNVDAPTGGGHPPTKKPIGIRFGLAARALVYGENIEYSGPMPSASLSSVQGNQFIIGFTHLGNGLVTGSEFQPTGAPVPFKLAGSNGTYFTATGQIVGNTVVVTSASVPNPVSVEYIWDVSQGNLYNIVNVPSFYGPVTRLPVPSFKLTLSGGPTPTPGPTATPTATPTRTNTPAPTNTPTAGPSPTPTSTNTSAPPTNTPTATNTPGPTNTPGGSTVMHVQDIFTTDVNGTPKTTFIAGTDTIYWRVQIVDQNGVPVSGAAVVTQLLNPSGGTWATQTQTTNASGWALFNKSTQNNNANGTYTINVTNVTKTGATYNPAANVKSSTTFVMQ